MALELQHSLQWWKKVLQYGVTESKPWKEPEGADIHIFCDAAGSGRLGAVLLAGRQVFFVHQQAPKELSQFFMVRSDKQILGLELLAISLALSSFAHLLRGRRVVIHSDNTGSEVEFIFFCLTVGEYVAPLAGMLSQRHSQKMRSRTARACAMVASS